MRRAKLVVALAACFAGLLLFAAVPALAITQNPQWTVTSVSRPTNFKPDDESGESSYKVTVTNTGGASSDGTPIEITDELPAGLTLDPSGAFGEDALALAYHTPPRAKFSCISTTCTYTGVVVPDQTLVITFPVDVSALAPPAVTNVVRVAGGGAPDAAMETPTTISSVPAGFGISPGGAATALSSIQAGAHPDITTSIAFNTVNPQGTLAGAPKETVDDLPPGFAGADLVDTPSCPAAEFHQRECPIATQIGTTTATFIGHTDTFFTQATNNEPVYNLTPDPGEAAKIGFVVEANAFIEGGIFLRGDYGPRAVFENIRQSVLELDTVSLTLWGVPADPIHDPLRFKRTEGNGNLGAPSDAARTPWFTNATSCGTEPLKATFTANSWEEPSHNVNAQMPFGPLVGCDRLTIEPKMETIPTSPSAESATGLDVDLRIPQTYDNPDGLATSHLKDVKVTLPEGMSLNPSAGSGLGYCTEAQLAYEGSTADPAFGLGCPNESRVGTIHVHSPVIAEEATGALFVARPFENPFHSLLALYLVARIPNRGVVVTAAGKVSPDPVTGQLTTTFDENPQLPFSDFSLRFKQGATSPLVTPPACGTFTTNAVLTPWSVPTQEHLVSSPFEITSGVGDSPCPSGGLPPFHPGLVAGTVNNAAGHYSPFYIRLSRQDGEQEITHFSIKLPPGVVGKLAGVPLCTDAEIEKALSRSHEGMAAQEEADPSCPAASEVGHTIVEAGVGTVLAQAPGKIYLAGPYHGSAISVVSITAAKVGPFDLGTVVVREALKVNPETGEVFVDATGSDPIPHIVDGVPTHLRTIRIYMDRPEFVLNPTSCEPTSTASTVLGSGLNFASEADDNPITVTSPFQAADCAALPFKPRLKLSLLGGTKRGAHPKLRAELRMREGEANIARAQVTLPHSEFLENAHIKTICTRVQFNQGNVPGEECPAGSVYGYARAFTPILDDPLEGPVYLRSSEHQLPDLVAALHNGEINIALVGRIDSVNGQIRNTFEAVPDAPVESFTLEMQGGAKGLLVNSENLCNGTHRAIVNFDAHNGKIADTTPAVGAQCSARKHKHKGKHRRGKRRH